MSDQTQNALRLAELATQVSQISARAMTLTTDALRWRRAGEELPEPGVDVIVAMRGKHCYIAEFSKAGGERFWITDGDSDYVHAVDLWLPIPPRPKAE